MSVLSASDRRLLLSLARAAVEARVLGKPGPEPGDVSASLSAPGAAFVSLHCGRELRGCLGCIEPRGPSLVATVIAMATAAAADDPRFAPLAAGELAQTTIEVSVLGPLLPITSPRDLIIGRDGLVVEHGGCRGLLLPQVAIEWGWDAETFVAETCRKAGLPRSAWREGASLYRFEAEVFSDASAYHAAG